MLKTENSCHLLELQSLLGKKWTLPILLEIKRKSITFNQIKKKTNNRINSSLLSETLKQLIELNLLKKINKDKIYYELTESGKNLIFIIDQMKDWAKHNNLNVGNNCKKDSCMGCNYFINSNCFI